MSSSERARLSWARIEKSPQPGHQRTSCPVSRSAAVSVGSVAVITEARSTKAEGRIQTRSPGAAREEDDAASFHHGHDGLLDLADEKRLPLHLVQTGDVEEQFGAQEESQVTSVQ